MTTPPITELLAGTSRGDAAALQQLYAVLYPEIKRVARMRLAQSGPNGRMAGLNTTALVHEGFLRMADQQGLQGDTRGQFFAYVGRVLRSVVIDHLRTEGRDKRGGDAVMVTLSAANDVAAVQSQAVDLIGLDQALARMRELDANLYELIEMVGFAGLSIAEVATLRDVSSRSINRELLKARALLQELLGDPPNTVY
ncbi:MAG: sigma-70 family RNA polymerase sigma factor [Burkholderiales bacterium]|nr:sigma-70 family RNA polymerase sigma factor [Burkholderiales bacterium]